MTNLRGTTGCLCRRHNIAGILVASAVCMMIPATGFAAGGGGTAGPSTAVKFEPVQGTNLKRVILTSKAAERLGIVIAKITEKPIVMTQMVGGQVTNSLMIEQKLQASTSFSGFALIAFKGSQPVTKVPTPAEAGGTWLSLTLSPEEWSRLDKTAAARVTPLATRNKPMREITAARASMEPIFDPKRTMLTVHYVVPGKDHGLAMNDRVRVELTLTGSGRTEMVVPYGAVYYDGKGIPWVYVQTKPLTYERKRVVVDRIVGNDAVLKSGPPLGTEVVSVGAALLFGAEVIYKR